MSSEQIISKPKKIMTPELLANLEAARAKARIKRQEQAELTKLKKELEAKTKADEINMLRQKLGKVSQPETDVESDQDEPVIKKKKKGQKPIVIVEESESDSEDEQVVYIKRKSNKPKAQVLEEEPYYQPPEPVQQQAPVSAPPPVYQSPYQGMHPSMLRRGRF